ncbi:uncharacterized protein LOC116614457 [Nematostella vectensis]|uniref:uncharacterized protein LOC116614457 n=1 Tax=Nematostella vectensis TaxID=45351 RepID=UPI0013904986|nr:uncharacterized protein LOC116614457 [Nematostella vectensis]
MISNLMRKQRVLFLCLLLCILLVTFINLGALKTPTRFLVSQGRPRTQHDTDLLLPESVQAENTNMSRTFCSMTYEHGPMCPSLYIDIEGSTCEWRNASQTAWNCSDIRTAAATDLRQAQLAMTRMLRVFDLVCRKHKIKYWITSATLLGAARHKGFIPWDSDADIEIPLEDYERFFKIASQDLPEDIFFQNSESDVNLRPDNESYERMKYKDIGLYRRTYNPRLRDRNSCYKYCLAHGCTWHDGLMVDMYVVEKAPKSYFPLKELVFEGFNLVVPNNWKSVLKNKYGSGYMDVPGEGSENRFRWDWPDPIHSCESLAKKS